MEHYHVVDSFGKRGRPILVPRVVIRDYNEEEGTFRLSISIVNEGFILVK